MQQYTIIYGNKELDHYGSLIINDLGLHLAIKTAKESLASLLGCLQKEVPIYQVYQNGKELPLWEANNCPKDLKRL